MSRGLGDVYKRQGWVGISTHMDMHGNLRVKTETLVALNITSADQSDDTQFADS